MAKESVRIAAVAAAVGFLGLAAFQGALALGAPLGAASWGGAYEGQLPMGLRIASGVAVGVYVLAALIVLGRAGFRGVPLRYGFLRWGTWVLVGLMFVGALENFASSSVWERFGWGPVSLILALLCLFVALRAGPVSRGG
jgi:hypothetical protein